MNIICQPHVLPHHVLLPLPLSSVAFPVPSLQLQPISYQGRNI